MCRHNFRHLVIASVVYGPIYIYVYAAYICSLFRYIHCILQVPCFSFSPEYPGVTFFLNPRKESVTSEGTSILLADIGLEIDIPSGAVPKGEELQLSVWPTMTGPYSLPEDCSLASPVYLINPVFEFLCDITLKIHHFCCLETEQQCEDMFFISSPLIPSVVKNNIQYKFKALSNGSFEPFKNYGSVSLKHFCYLGLGKRKRSSYEQQENASIEEMEKKCRALNSNFVYYQNKIFMYKLYCLQIMQLKITTGCKCLSVMMTILQSFQPI